MFYRRVLLPVVAVATLTTGCRLFRPVNPHAPRPQETSTAEKPAQKPAEQPATRTAPKSEAKVNATQASGPITDANIAAMVIASNNTDVSYARLVPSRAQRDDVKQFAQRMLTDHVGVNGLVNDLLGKLDLVPEDNTASLDMRDESSEKRDLMRELSGFAFDSTYMENEVAYHRKFLASIDGVMLPRARNADLKALLSAVRPAVAAHLAHAEQVRANVLSKK